MSLSALSTVLITAVLASSGHGQMSSNEFSAYRLVAPSIANIVRGREAVGTAALVDPTGLFLAHLDSVYGKRVNARLSDGRLISLTLRAEDDQTQLAILQADDWIKSARPLPPAEDLKSGDRLMAVLPTGLIRAEYVGGKSGVLASNRRLMPLSEISFEAPADRIGGGLVMTPSGNLVGFMNAALHNSGEADILVKPSKVQGGGEGEGVLPKGAAPSIAPMAVQARNFGGAMGGGGKVGPGDMTVAYTPSTRMLRKTLASLIRGKDVDRPSIGVDVKNSPDNNGALIERVEPGSGADQAGLKAGDIVVEIDGQDINSQMDLAQVIMDQEVGATLRVKVKRGRTLLIVPVVVGSKPAKAHSGPQSST